MAGETTETRALLEERWRMTPTCKAHSWGMVVKQARQCSTCGAVQIVDDGSTHWEGCWDGGRRHYECAVAEIRRLSHTEERQ